MAPSTIFQLPQAGSMGVSSFLARLVKQLPAYTLELGTALIGYQPSNFKFLGERTMDQSPRLGERDRSSVSMVRPLYMRL